MAHFYTNQEIQFIKDNVCGISLKELTERFNNRFNTNVSQSSIANIKFKYGLKSGYNSGCFNKNHVPANKGKKMPKNLYEKVKATMFKPGDKPKNTKPIGSVRKGADGYWVKKYHDNKIPGSKNWELMHRHIWEEANGSIPDGCVIIFKDGNKDHIELDNLMIVTKQERLVMARKHLFKESADLTETGVILAKVITKTTEKEKYT